MIQELLPVLAVVAASLLCLVFLFRRYPAAEARWMTASLATHAAAVFVQLYLVFEIYQTGDLVMYHRYGVDLAESLRLDFWGVAPGIVRVLFQQASGLSVYVPAAESNTATMVALVAMCAFVLQDSLVAISLAFALASFLGKLVLYQAVREVTPPRLAVPLLVSIVLVPSVVFWSAGIVKEAVVMPGIGLFVLGLLRSVRGRRASVIWLVAGATMTALIKPYVLLMLVVAAGGFLYGHRIAKGDGVAGRPIALLFAALVVLLGVWAVGEVFPRFSFDRLAEETARMQSVAFKPAGGSAYVIGDPEARSLLAQLGFAPFGLFTALFRPLPTEAHNPQMIVSSLESMALLLLSALVVSRQSPRRAWTTLRRYPVVAFCLVFVVAFGVAVGLTAANLGTLSRYRMPLLPFLTVGLVLLGQRPVGRATGVRTNTISAVARKGTSGMR